MTTVQTTQARQRLDVAFIDYVCAATGADITDIDCSAFNEMLDDIEAMA